MGDAFSYVDGSFDVRDPVGASGSTTSRAEAERAEYIARLERRLAVRGGRGAPVPASLLDPSSPAGMRALAREIGSSRAHHQGGTEQAFASGATGTVSAYDDRKPLLVDAGDDDVLLLGFGEPEGGGPRVTRDRAAASQLRDSEPSCWSVLCDCLNRARRAVVV